MQDNVRQFSINQINEVATENSMEFCYARICVLSTRPNTHKVLITEEILRRDGVSVRGKWIVCDFSKFTLDATTHTENEKIVGIVPHNAKIDFVQEDDGTVSMYVDAIISKIYAKEIYDMFRVDNFRNVSVEMVTKDKPRTSDGSIPIEGLNIVGITILGKSVNGSCPNANMSIVKFSIDEAEKYYNESENTEIKNKEFSDENLVDIEIKDNKEDNMEETMNLSMSVETEKQEDVIMESETTEEIVEEKVETTEQMEEFAESEETVEEKEEQVEEMACGKEESMACGTEEMACGTEEMSEGTEVEMAIDTTEISEEVFAEETETDSVDEETTEEKSFSLSEYVGAELIEGIEEPMKEFVEQIISMSAEDLIQKVVELKKFQDERLAIDKDMKLTSIMASVKGDLDEKTFSELQEEGKQLKIEELGGFENKVKAFAYEATKDKHQKEDEEEIMRFAGAKTVQKEAELTAEDIYNKYL